jgi:3',5'-cyclic AMP phosphodiesterase CpdA
MLGMAAVKLAHCSDLHLLSHAGARWVELANKRWIGAANLIGTRSRHYHVAAFEDMIADINALGIDHVLCTGDVTNLAMRREFEFARGKFDTLTAGSTHVTVIPGNHDAYIAEGVPLFLELFADYATTDAGWEHEERWPIVRIRGDLALIALSTSMATPWFTAYGRVGQGQLERLGQILVDERLRGKVRVVAIHHPPAGHRAKKKIRGLRDHEDFARVIAECGADLIVHGHEHVDVSEVLSGPAGPVPVRGVQSGTYFHNKPDRTARYRIFEIENGAIHSEHERIWDPEEHAFRRASP